MRIAFEQDLQRDEILKFIVTIPEANFFHTPAWMESLTAAFPRFKPRYVTARDAGELAGLMPFVEVTKGPFHAMYALPFGTYGDPLTREPAIGKAILDKFFELSRPASCLEAFAYLFSTDYDDLPEGTNVEMKQCHLVVIKDGLEEFWRNGISRKKRQIYNKGKRAGVVVRVLENEEELREFYKLYLVGSRTWGGVHPYPYELFNELFKRSDEGVLIWGGFLEGRLLGGHVDLCFGEMEQAWQAGMSKEAHGYGIGSLLIMEAVETAYKRGVKLLNLGTSNGDKGLIFFKESLGGRQHIYPIVGIRKRWWRWIRRR